MIYRNPNFEVKDKTKGKPKTKMKNIPMNFMENIITSPKNIDEFVVIANIRKKENELYLKSFAETDFLRYFKKELVRLCMVQHKTKGLIFFDPDIINHELAILNKNGWAINSGILIHKSFQVITTIPGYENIKWRTTEDMAIPWGETKKHYKVFVELLEV